MARRLSKVERAKQVARWLRHAHPTRMPVRLRFVDRVPADRDEPPFYRRLGYFADIRLRAGVWYIRLSTRRNQDVSVMIETLLHEWAHAVVELADHPDSWARAYGCIYRSWHDEDGWEASGAF